MVAPGKEPQRGVMLIESLVAVVIFSIGLLALIGLQAVAIREISEAKYRSDASFLADRVMGELLATGADNGAATVLALAGTYSAISNAATPFGRAVTDTNTGLPAGQLVIAVAGNPPVVTVTVTWQRPGAVSHTFAQSATLIP